MRPFCCRSNIVTFNVGVIPQLVTFNSVCVTVAVANSIPFVGFGFLDNFFMLLFVSISWCEVCGRLLVWNVTLVTHCANRRHFSTLWHLFCRNGINLLIATRITPRGDVYQVFYLTCIHVVCLQRVLSS